MTLVGNLFSLHLDIPYVSPRMLPPSPIFCAGQMSWACLRKIVSLCPLFLRPFRRLYFLSRLEMFLTPFSSVGDLRYLPLRLEKYSNHFSSHSVPIRGPFLFAGKFMEAVDEELSMHKRASDIARRLAPLTSGAFKRANPSPFKRPFSGSFPSAKRFAPSRSRHSFCGSRGGFRGSRLSRGRSSHPSFPSPPPPPSPNPSDYARDLFPGPVGGRLSPFLSAWQTITKDPFILSVVAHGFQISVFPDFPGVLRKTTPTLLDPSAHLRVLEEISSLILKRAIIQVVDSPSLSLSPIFVIPKRTGGLRVILNLKAINVFIPPQHFRMETLASILPTLSPQDWAVSIDLKDAYHHVPVHRSSRYLLGFQYQGRTFQYQVLPFGLKDSPWVFTHLVSTLVGYLRCRGIRIHYYLDDWLIMASSRSLLLSHLQESLFCAQSLSFLINWEKSSLVPSQVPIFLGAVLDSAAIFAEKSEIGRSGQPWSADHSGSEWSEVS